MKITLLTSLVIFTGTLGTGKAYPGGAPNTTCTSMSPGHYPINAPSTQPPFTVTVSGNTYGPGSSVTVTISSPCGKTFRGFMLQARRADSDQDTTAALGTFSTPAGSQTRTCGSGQAVTHTGRNDKTSMTFMWTAPSQAVGHIVFRATIVETYSSLWTEVYSRAVLQMNLQTAVQPGSNVYPSVHGCPATTSTTQAMSIKTTTSQGMRLMFDPACGVTKGCATDCNGGSCSFLVKWNFPSTGEYVRFEMTAVLHHGQNQWMAIGLSDDTRMGNDSVTECVSYNGQISVYSSYNYPSIKYNSRLPEKYYGVNKVSSSLVNGVFTCTFDRQIADALHTDFFGLTLRRYMLFASGRTEEFSDEKQSHTDHPPTTFRRVNFFSPELYDVGYMTTAGQMKTMCVQPMLLIILAWIVKTVF